MHLNSHFNTSIYLKCWNDCYSTEAIILLEYKLLLIKSQQIAKRILSYSILLRSLIILYSFYIILIIMANACVTVLRNIHVFYLGLFLIFKKLNNQLNSFLAKANGICKYFEIFYFLILFEWEKLCVYKLFHVIHDVLITIKKTASLCDVLPGTRNLSFIILKF